MKSDSLQQKVLDLLNRQPRSDDPNDFWALNAAFDEIGLATYLSFQNLLCHKVIFKGLKTPRNKILYFSQK